ncbi:MAG: hypothetical protein LBT70_02780 [Holosporaceae bacterium]|jgi:hypothetical protein|nr:hypothetical protein [Holosporaceae bacterium]
MHRRRGKFSLAGYVICSIILHTLLFSLGFITIPRGENNLLIDVEISGENQLPYEENYPEEIAESAEHIETQKPEISPEIPFEPLPEPQPEEAPPQEIVPADDPLPEETPPEQIPSIEEISPEDIKIYEKESEIKEEQPVPTPPEDAKPEPAPPEDAKPEPAPPEDAKPEPVPPEDAKPEPAPPKEKKPEPTPQKEKKPESAPLKTKKTVEKVKKKHRKTIKDIVEKSVRDQSDREFDKMLGNSMTDLQKSHGKRQPEHKTESFGSGGGISESDNELIMSQIYPHWAVASGIKNAENLVIEINVELRDNGEVILSSVEILDQERYLNDSTFRAAADSAKRAILLASPLNIPKNKIDLLREITLRFNMKKALRR